MSKMGHRRDFSAPSGCVDAQEPRAGQGWSGVSSSALRRAELYLEALQEIKHTEGPGPPKPSGMSYVGSIL